MLLFLSFFSPKEATSIILSQTRKSTMVNKYRKEYFPVGPIRESIPGSPHLVPTVLTAKSPRLSIYKTGNKNRPYKKLHPLYFQFH